MHILLVFYKLSTIIYSLCRGVIYKDVGILLGGSLACEQLVGVFTGDGEVGLGQKKQSKRVQIVCSRTTHARGK